MAPRAAVMSSRMGRNSLRVLAFCALFVAGLAPPSALAGLTSITTRPATPTVCDSVGLIVAGEMPDPCHHVIRAEIEGPTALDTMGPIPVYGIRVRITVQEPNPLLDIACPTVIQPYDRGFRLGALPFGHYIVNAVEYLVPFTQDSTATPTDSSLLSSTFLVGQGPCQPGRDCYMLSFGPSTNSAPDDPTRVDPCDARARPGGTACFDVLIANEIAVGGLQTEIVIFDPRPPPNTTIAADLFRPISVEVTGRASNFKVAWSTEGISRTKILLFSTDGSTIAPGQGPILHVCYAVSAEAREGRYPTRHHNVIVADPRGVEMAPCPTFAEIVGSICVIKGTGCDLNGDGESNIRDVILLVNCALAGHGGTAACPDSVAAKADCNGDGRLDIRDVICCVRRILSDGFGTGSGSGDPGTGWRTRIGFLPQAGWVSPSTGRATIEVYPGPDYGGTQFAVTATGGIRIRGLSIVDRPPWGGHTLEWAAENGTARAVIFPGAPGAPAPSRSPGGAEPRISIEVEFEHIPGTSGQGGLSVSNVETATSWGGSAPTDVSAATVGIPTSPYAPQPTVSAPAPNPFAAETAIHYALPTPQHVVIRVYNVNGRLIRTLTDATMPAGNHTASWDGRDADGRELSSGIYFFKFAAGGIEKTNRLLKLR